MDILRKGLNSFQLKLIGLLLMTLDHIYEFFKYTGNIPIEFKWVGRVVAPIFMFLTVEGYTHTRSKKKYMLRLYIGSLIMSLGNYIIPIYLGKSDEFIIKNNIFSTLLMIVLYMRIIDFFRESIIEKDNTRKLLSILFMILPFVIGISVITIANVTNLEFLKYIIPNIFLVEGGSVLVLIGVIFYITKNDFCRMIKSYIIFCIALFVGSLLESGFNIRELFFENYQWMMVFSIFFFDLYNGKKGRGLKYLFYIFYPAHIYILYIISYFLMT